MNDKAQKMQQMMDKVDEYPDTWKWDEHGDTIQGTFARLDWGPSQFTESGKVPIYVIEDDNGKEWSVWGRYEVLRREFVEQNIQPGDYVGIKNLGKPEGKNYVRCVVRVLPAGGKSIDWGVVGKVEVADTDEYVTDAQPTETWQQQQQAVTANSWVENRTEQEPLRAGAEQAAVEVARSIIRHALSQREALPSDILLKAKQYGHDASSVGELLITAPDDVLTSVASDVKNGIY